MQIRASHETLLQKIRVGIKLSLKFNSASKVLSFDFDSDSIGRYHGRNFDIENSPAPVRTTRRDALPERMRIDVAHPGRATG